MPLFSELRAVSSGQGHNYVLRNNGWGAPFTKLGFGDLTLSIPTAADRSRPRYSAGFFALPPTGLTSQLSFTEPLKSTF